MQQKLSDTHRAYLRNRGITDSTLESFSVHTSPANEIVIPVFSSDGEHIFNKYRRDPLQTIGPKYRYDKGASISLYGAHLLNRTGPVVVTEGELDTLVLHSMNIQAVSSTGGAMSFQDSWTSLMQDRRVYLCFDNDSAGAEGMVRTLRLVPHAHVILIPEQPGVKDISDFVARGGDFHHLMESALHPSDLGTVHQDRIKRMGQWQSTRFHDRYIEENTVVKTPAPKSTGTSDKSGDLLRAKQYPMTNLIQFTRNKACCPFHNEKTPSFAYYPENNTAYCFGSCGKAFDVLDVYQKIHGCDLKTAIKEVNQLL